MKNVFLEVQNRLTSMNVFGYIDKNWGQLQYEQPSVKFPCALIDIADIMFSDTSRGAEIADGYVDITIGALHHVHTSAGESLRSIGYNVYDLIDAVNKKLHGWKGTCFDKMIRQSVTKDSSGVGMDVYVIRYHITWMCSTEEYSVATLTEVSIDADTYTDVVS